MPVVAPPHSWVAVIGGRYLRAVVVAFVPPHSWGAVADAGCSRAAVVSVPPHPCAVAAGAGYPRAAVHQRGDFSPGCIDPPGAAPRNPQGPDPGNRRAVPVEFFPEQHQEGRCLAGWRGVEWDRMAGVHVLFLRLGAETRALPHPVLNAFPPLAGQHQGRGSEPPGSGFLFRVDGCQCRD